MHNFIPFERVSVEHYFIELNDFALYCRPLYGQVIIQAMANIASYICTKQ